MIRLNVILIGLCHAYTLINYILKFSVCLALLTFSSDKIVIFYHKVMRQDEPDLINAVNELCDGSPSQPTVDLMKNLARPLEEVNPTLLFGTRLDVDIVNHDKLYQLQGQQINFKAEDSGKLDDHSSFKIYNHNNSQWNFILDNKPITYGRAGLTEHPTLARTTRNLKCFTQLARFFKNITYSLLH